MFRGEIGNLNLPVVLKRQKERNYAAKHGEISQQKSDFRREILPCFAAKIYQLNVFVFSLALKFRSDFAAKNHN